MLSQQKLEEINTSLPTLDDRFLIATSRGPSIDINDLIKGESLGVALVCLEDAGERFNLVRFSLYEALACLTWYRNESPKAPLEGEAVLTGKFYADYAALLLYAMGEDIAAFIINFLGVDAQLKNYLQDNEPRLKRKNVFSTAAKVGIFMTSQYPNAPITESILALNKDQSWQKAISYRNAWVHEKPPIIHGLGIQYDRRSRVSKDGKSISFGGGSEHKYTVDELLRIAISATEASAKTLSALLDIVIKRREGLGEKLDFILRLD
ncbi:MAG: hypothetical protein R3C14_43825 [Caldilineaceae bacterium]